MTPEQLALLHAECFTNPRPWSAAEFAASLEIRGVFLLTHANAFLLGRAIADEAELLTLAVAPDMRRRGIARDLVRQFVESSHARHADDLFLEVAADNLVALNLYQSSGWKAAGRRPDYYGRGLDAIIMRLTHPLQI